MRNKLVKFLCASIVSAQVIAGTSPVYASSKELTVDLETSYTNCTFTLDMKKSGTYTAYVVDPDGNKHDCQALSDTVLVVTLPNAGVGTYTAHVENSSDDSVGKVKLSVTSTAEESSSVDNASVSKDIAGLSVYLKDRTVKATWTDSTTESVTVSVANAQTNEVIGTQSSQTQSCEVEVPEGVSSVLVTVSSSNLSQDLTYTFNLDEAYEATVTYPEKDYVNTEYITATVSMDIAYNIYVETNGTAVANEEITEAGKYSVDIPLTEDGENNVVLYLVDDNGNMKGYEYSVIKDTEGPEVSFDETYDNIVTSNSDISIQGVAADCNKLTINDEEVSVSQDGSFSGDITLADGDNTITVVATDLAGNETVNEFIVTLDTTGPNYTLYFAIGACGIIGALFVRARRNAKRVIKTKKTTKKTTKKSTNKVTKETKAKEDTPVNEVDFFERWKKQ